jgi:hypothetical protein
MGRRGEVPAMCAEEKERAHRQPAVTEQASKNVVAENCVRDKKNSINAGIFGRIIGLRCCSAVSRNRHTQRRTKGRRIAKGSVV